MRPRPAHGPKGEETRLSEHHALREKTEEGRGKMENDNYNTGGTGATLFAGKSADAANGQVQHLFLDQFDNLIIIKFSVRQKVF